MTTRWRSLVTDTRLIMIGLLIGLGLIYLPTLSHAFVWDDLTFVRALWPLRDPASWWTAVQQPFPITPGYFRPLGVLFLTMEFSLAGRNPALFHLVSVALLLLNTALVAWLARLAWPERRSAPIVALLLYGLHPALIEGVAFISSQFDLLLTTCLLLALIAETKIQRRSDTGRYRGAALFAGGLDQRDGGGSGVRPAVVAVEPRSIGRSLAITFQRSITDLPGLDRSGLDLSGAAPECVGQSAAFDFVASTPVAMCFNASC